VLVGDRGMITESRLTQDVRIHEGLDWIICLRGPTIRTLVRNHEQLLQMSLFDERGLVEISDPSFPGERLIVCRNPLLAAERARKREELLQSTEKQLEAVTKATTRARRPVTGKDKIALRVGRSWTNTRRQNTS
jgi:hypothetical protein